MEKLLEAHASKPANPLLAGAFFRTGDIESCGRGIDKIREACSENGADFPQFEAEPTGLSVEFKAALPEESQDADKNRGETVGETVGKTVGEILQLIRQNPQITRFGLSEATGLSIRGVEWNLAKLKKDGLLIRVGSTKSGHWEVVE